MRDWPSCDRCEKPAKFNMQDILKIYTIEPNGKNDHKYEVLDERYAEATNDHLCEDHAEEEYDCT